MMSERARMQEPITPDLKAWARGTIARAGQKAARVSTRRKRKLLVVHLDGVPEPILKQGVESGRMPFLASLLRSGAYHMDGAFWGSPASTPCFQAGLLYGIRHPNLPAYHWYDRELGRVMRMDTPIDAAHVERRLGLSAPKGLLEDGGTAYLSLFSGHAPNHLCMTGLADLPGLVRGLISESGGLGACARQPALHAAGQVLRETWSATCDVARWSLHVRDVRNELKFLTSHFFILSLAWSVAHRRALLDMVRGVPAIYLVFGNFDEVAHRRGPRSGQAAEQLHRVDARLAELYAVGKSLEEPYDFYFVTDHGHVDSAPFERRSGQHVREYLLGGPAPRLSADVERALLDGRPPAAPPARDLAPDPAQVIDAGNFAHVYLSGEKEPLEARAILARHRAVLSRAVAHSDVGVVALRRGKGAVAVVRGGVYGPDEVDRAPLPTAFSQRALADLLRELPHMSTAGDLVLFGQALEPHGTVGFAWEFGSHGGLTHVETGSLILWPVDANLDLSGLSHATQLHHRLSEVYRA